MTAVPEYLSIVPGGPDPPERVPMLRRRADVERALELGERALALIKEATSLFLEEDYEDGIFEDWIRDLPNILKQRGEFVAIRWLGPGNGLDWVERVRRENEELLAGREFVPEPASEEVFTYG